MIDGETNNIIATIPVGAWPIDLTYNPANNKIYCANNWRDTVTVIDGTINSVITAIPVGDEPYALIYNPTNNKVYCANEFSNDITVIDGAADSVITVIEVGDGPIAFAYNPQYNRVYVANYYGNSVSVILDVIPWVRERTMLDVSRNTIEVYPNPAKTIFTISSATHLHSIRVYNALGELVRTEDVSQYEIGKSISVKNLSAGAYFVKVNTEDNEFIRKVLVAK